MPCSSQELAEAYHHDDGLGQPLHLRGEARIAEPNVLCA